jgi:septum formation protein
VLGADTIVVLDKKILGKPQNAQDALGTLLELSNKEHQVLTGCTLIDPDTPDPHSFTALSRVYIGPQPLNVLQAYVESGEPLDKAGSYAIQGVGSFLVESITGSFSNVVGLPLSELTKLLQKTGVIAPLSSSHGHRTRPKTGHDVPAWS